MRYLLAAAASLIIASAAHADELAEANKFLEARAYPQAIAIYSRLAVAGSAEAQFRLGEMHWYGEGYPANDGKAREWFTKAASAGSQPAIAALETMRQRELRRADIDYYVSKYDGADLAYAAYKCETPDIPASSLGKDTVLRINRQYEQWQTCYNGFVQNLQAALPAGTKIPKDIADLMNEQEFNSARQRMDTAYTALAAEGKRQAAPVLAKYEAWYAASEKLAAEESARFKGAKEAADSALRAQQARQEGYRDRHVTSAPVRR